MSPWRDNGFRGALRWASTAATFALAPKCVLCLGAYAGVGAWFGIKVAPEFCGGSAGMTSSSSFWLALLATTIATSVIAWSRVLCGCLRARASVVRSSVAPGR